jgi:hypothetical protein
MAKTARWPDLPDLAGVTALLDRADWARLSLAGEVSQSRDWVSNGGRPKKHGHAGSTFSLHVAPGRRFRLDHGKLVNGCDGTRAWTWRADPPPDSIDYWRPPFATQPFVPLLSPSWLLTGYDLEVLGPWLACGRSGIRVAGTLRRPLAEKAGIGSILDDLADAPDDRAEVVIDVGRGILVRRVEVIIDAELGILLRRKRSGSNKWRTCNEVLEFRQLEMDPNVDEAMFGPPPGARVSERP